MNEKYVDREKQSHKKQQEKEKRLATALRDNLFRRKAQARCTNDRHFQKSEAKVKLRRTIEIYG